MLKGNVARCSKKMPKGEGLGVQDYHHKQRGKRRRLWTGSTSAHSRQPRGGLDLTCCCGWCFVWFRKDGPTRRPGSKLKSRVCRDASHANDAKTCKDAQ